MVDLRSDTVTHPTDAMRRAMLEAPLGDDVFGDDPTVNALEREAAIFLGKESALFVPSGTMANTIAIAISTRPGDEMILMDDCHVFLHEGGGSARLWGVHSRPLRGRRGCLEPSDVEVAIRADDPHHPCTRLVCLENTHNMQGGLVVTPDRIDAVAEVCRRHGLKLHLDGARLSHAAVALGVPVPRLTASVDTVSCCFSKGLSSPVGSVVAGTTTAMAEARRVRKTLGGGMRQVGILAACARVSLEEGVQRLEQDHARMRAIADGLRKIDGVRLLPDPPETNILFVVVAGVEIAGYGEIVHELEDRGVRTCAHGERGIRLVTHRHVADEDVEKVVEGFRAVLAGGGRRR